MLSDEEKQFEVLKQFLYKLGGLDYRGYKTNYLKRRLAVRLRATGLTTYREYQHLLQRDPTEYDKLLDRLTINVSQFYRDPEAYGSLVRNVLPKLAKRERARIWSAGCANGEEPYTLAMIFHERLPMGQKTKILATDIDAACLARAEAGLFKEPALVNVPLNMRWKYLERQGDQWAVSPALRNGITFRRHDLTGEMPAGSFDLIVCRNVMIYFNRQLQERLLRGFHKLLAPAGFLMLGKTEVLFAECRSLYHTIDVGERIYQYRAPERTPDRAPECGPGRPG